MKAAQEAVFLHWNTAWWNKVTKVNFAFMSTLVFLLWSTESLKLNLNKLRPFCLNNFPLYGLLFQRETSLKYICIPIKVSLMGVFQNLVFQVTPHKDLTTPSLLYLPLILIPRLLSLYESSSMCSTVPQGPLQGSLLIIRRSTFPILTSCTCATSVSSSGILPPPVLLLQQASH